MIENLLFSGNSIYSVGSVSGDIRKILNRVYPMREANAIVKRLFNEFPGLSSAGVILNSDVIIGSGNLKLLYAAVDLLKKKMPLQYVLGHCEFYELRFKTDYRALIPRPETEELVAWILNNATQRVETTLRILDVGTGCGCIAVALKKNILNSEVLALDVSDEALSLATENALVHGACIKFIKADILDSDSLKEVMKNINPNTSAGIDIVVSNPPYIEKKDSSAMDANVLDYEPHRALFVPDKKPLLFYEAIAGFALKIMNPGGKLYFETNEKYGGELARMLEAKGFCNCEMKKDIHGKNRMLRCILKGLSEMR